MRLGELIFNPVDAKDGGQYKIVVVRKYGHYWTYTATAQTESCIYKTIGGSLI